MNLKGLHSGHGRKNLQNLNNYAIPAATPWGEATVFDEDDDRSAWEMFTPAAGRQGTFYDFNTNAWDHPSYAPYATTGTWGAPGIVGTGVFGTPYGAYGPWT